MNKYRQRLFQGATRQIFKNANDLRKRLTNAEKTLWAALRGRKFHGLKFRRQHPYTHYILDFYCPEVKVAIELDGCIHHRPEVMEYDLARTKDLNQFGIQVLRFTNEEIETNLERVLEKIASCLTPDPLSSRRGGRGEGKRPPGEGVGGEAEDKKNLPFRRDFYAIV